MVLWLLLFDDDDDDDADAVCLVFVGTRVVYFCWCCCHCWFVHLDNNNHQKKKKKKEQEPLQGQIHRQARTGVTRSMYMHVCVCMDMYTPKLQLVYVCASARRCRTS